MTSPSVYSIDAGMPFARELAVGIAKLADSPERLARGLILLPSRRAASALQTAFLDGAVRAPNSPALGARSADSDAVLEEARVLRSFESHPGECASRSGATRFV